MSAELKINRGGRPMMPLSTPVVMNNPNSKAPWSTHLGSSSTSLLSQKSLSNLKVGEEKSLDGSVSKVSVTESVTKTKKVLDKILRRAPPELIDDLSAVASLSISASEALTKNTELRSLETMSLRSELRKKNQELENAKKGSEIIRQRLQTVEEMFTELRDSIDAKGKAASRNQRMLTKMSKDNRMLVDTLNTLDLPADDDGFSPSDLKSRQALLPGMGEDKSSEFAIGKNDMYSLNIKLKESLLRMSREHYRSSKSVKVMSASLEQLQSALKAAEQKNRTLQHDLDELRNEGLTTALDATKEENAESSGPKVHNFGEFDEKFQALLERQAIDVVDSMMLLRRFISLLASAPITLITTDVCPHIASKELLNIFEVSMVCLYIRIPEKPGFMQKFTPRSRVPEIVDISATNCLVKEILKFGNPARLNSLRNISFNAVIDGVSGLRPQRVLSMPLKDITTGHAFGVIHFINKSYNNDIFTEGDELFATLFASQVESLLSHCNFYSRTKSRAQLFATLLRSSVDLMSVMPSQESLAKRPHVLPGEVLHGLETIAYEALKTAKCRAFLVTTEFIGMDGGNVIFLEKSMATGILRNASTLVTKTGLATSGIVGNVVKTGKVHQVESDVENDSFYNTEVDLDPLGSPMVTVAIKIPGGHDELNYRSGVVAVLQMVLGPFSLKLRPTADDHDGISFLQACNWLVHQLSPVLYQLLSCIKGNPLPVIAPQFLPAEAVPPADRLTSPNSRRPPPPGQPPQGQGHHGHHHHGHGAKPKPPGTPTSPDGGTQDGTQGTPGQGGDHPSHGSAEGAGAGAGGANKVYVDQDEYEGLKAKLAELQRAEKMRQSSGQRNTMFSIKGMLESPEPTKKASKKAEDDTKFLKFQLDQANAQLEQAKEHMQSAIEAQEAAEKAKKEVDTVVEELKEDITALKENEDLLVEQLTEKQQALEDALKQAERVVHAEERLQKKDVEVEALRESMNSLSEDNAKLQKELEKAKKTLSKLQKMTGESDSQSDMGMSVKVSARKMGNETSVRAPHLGVGKKSSVWGNSSIGVGESEPAPVKKSFWGGGLTGNSKTGTRENSGVEDGDHLTIETLRSELEERDNRLSRVEQILSQTQSKYNESLRANDTIEMQLQAAREAAAAKDKAIKNLQAEIEKLTKAHQDILDSVAKDLPDSKAAAARRNSMKANEDIQRHVASMVAQLRADDQQRSSPNSRKRSSADMSSSKSGTASPGAGFLSSIVSRVSFSKSAAGGSGSGDSSPMTSSSQRKAHKTRDGTLRDSFSRQDALKGIEIGEDGLPLASGAAEDSARGREHGDAVGDSGKGQDSESSGHLPDVLQELGREESLDEGNGDEAGDILSPLPTGATSLTPTGTGDDSWKEHDEPDEQSQELGSTSSGGQIAGMGSASSGGVGVGGGRRSYSAQSSGEHSSSCFMKPSTESEMERAGMDLFDGDDGYPYNSDDLRRESIESADAYDVPIVMGSKTGDDDSSNDNKSGSGGISAGGRAAGDDGVDNAAQAADVAASAGAGGVSSGEVVETAVIDSRTNGDHDHGAADIGAVYPSASADDAAAASASTAAEDADAAAYGGVVVGDWVQYFDDASGSPYWVNQVTGESAWELPPDAMSLAGLLGGSASGAGGLSHGSDRVSNSAPSNDGAYSAGGYTIEL